MESVSVVERLDKLAQARKAPQWGSAHLTVTPTSLAVQRLCAELAELQDVVREMALQIESLSRQDDTSDAPTARGAAEVGRGPRQAQRLSGY